MRLLFYISIAIALSSITLAKTTFSGERIKSSAEEYIRSILGDNVEISIAQKISNFSFQEDGVSAEFTSSAKTIRGACNLDVEFTSAGKLIKHYAIPVRVRIYKSVLTAARNISANTTITEDDVILQNYDVTDYSDNELLSNNYAIGKTLDRNITKGRPITKSALAKSFAIKRGSIVNLVINNGAIQISTQGRAQNSGMPGDEIKVMRDGSGGLLQGIADENGAVIIGGGK